MCVIAPLTSPLPSQLCRQQEFLTYLVGPRKLLVEMVTLKLLSTHAEGEQTLDMPNVLITVRRKGGVVAGWAGCAGECLLAICV